MEKHLKTSLTYVFLHLLALGSCVFDCNDYLNAEIRPQALNGVIWKKAKEETGCFGTIILKNIQGYDTLSGICYCVPDAANLWDYAATGDSLIKESGSTTVKVVSGGKERVFTFPCCNH